jgi:hypothetical protein
MPSPSALVRVLALSSCASALGCSRTPAGSVADPPALDSDGVQQLLPSAEGSAFLLGNQNPNHARGIQIEKGTPATPDTEQGIQYWSLLAHDLDYSSGGQGKTLRVHIHASGEQQRYTWQTQTGYLSNPRDLRNQEFTAYVRVHEIFDPVRAAVSLKIRGGAHTPRDGDLASCTMLTFAPRDSRGVTRFGKELHHPDYDYVALTPRLPIALEEQRWYGLKLISYAALGVPRSVVNRLYVDDRPFDAQGRPRNDWRLFSEYVDVEGENTGKYSKLVDWGGWQTTLRTDGVTGLDIAILSVREIEPP